MKNTLGPNWFLTHVPAPGSERSYNGLSGLEELSEMSRAPLTPMARVAAQDGAAERQQRKLERLAR